MNRFSQKELVDGIRRRDDRVLRFIYKSYYPLIMKLVLNNSGTEEDAKDVFQETLIVAFKNIRDNSDFNLESGLQTYLYSVARLKWLNVLRKTKNDNRLLKENHDFIEFEEPKPFNEKDIRYSVYQKAFLRLPDDCQQILRMSMDGMEQKEIADALGFRSENYIKKRKHFCKEFLVARIREDPEFDGKAG